MNRKRNARGRRIATRGVSGFTMVELLVVVGITSVLLALAFVAVINQRRSMFQVELDTTAQEVYVAAQNYLLSAKEEGLLDKSPNYGTVETDEGSGNVYYFAYDGSGNSGVNSPVGDGRYSALGLMLPFGSIDETIRLNGSYIIRYNKDTGMILDVLYASPRGMGGIFGDFGKATFNTSNAETALELVDRYDSDGKKIVDNSGARRDVETNENGALLNGGVLGYCGGEDILTGEELEKPHVEVENGDKLVVKVTNPNYAKEYASLVVIVEGKTSHAKNAFVLRGSNSSSLAEDKSENKGKTANSKYYYELVLDDITTSGHHFFDIFDSTTGFAPGEDIEVQAIAYSTSKLTNTARSLSKTDNSLFAALVPGSGGSSDLRAQITSFRHLENLDKSVSSLGATTAATDEDGSTVGDKSKTPKLIEIVGADLNTDLSWTSFVDANATTAVGADGEDTKTIKIYKYGNTEGYDANSFMPIKPDYTIDFNGDGHAIMQAEIKASGSNANAGLFDELSVSGSKIRNVNLIDFNVVSTSGNAGALAGQISSGVEVNNVNAYNSSKNITSDKSLIKGATAGGLIGSMEGGTIKVSSAAMFVQATGTSENDAAGGLIGAATSGATVTQCYSGGHTNDGVYSKTEGNVTSAATVGGLVGIAKSSSIEYSYSTCSAFGASSGVGGLAGSVVGGAIKNSYATGLVKGTSDTIPIGAFVGSTSGTPTFEADYYLGIANEASVGASSKGEVNGITEADKSTSDYQAFLHEQLPDGTTESRRNALPYDTELTKRYNNKYPFKTTSELKDSTAEPVLHHGDWPSYETFVVNTKSS